MCDQIWATNALWLSSKKDYGLKKCIVGDISVCTVVSPTKRNLQTMEFPMLNLGSGKMEESSLPVAVSSFFIFYTYQP